MFDPAPGRAVLFDFDGTLADSFSAITTSVNRVADAYGLPRYDEPHVRRLVGYGLGHLLSELFPDHDTDASIRIYRRDHSAIAREQTRLLPDVSETIVGLHRLGVRMAVCSNKAVAFTRELVDGLGLADYFAAVLGPEDVAEPKPAPDMLHEAMRRLGVTANETVYVGDMTVDIEAARAAGVPVWVLATGAQDDATLRRARPDRLLASFKEILLS